jgi:phosphate uptake regulator
MVRNSLDALVKRDEDLARSVLLSDNEVDLLRDSAYKELIGIMQEPKHNDSGRRRPNVYCAQSGTHR